MAWLVPYGAGQKDLKTNISLRDAQCSSTYRGHNSSIVFFPYCFTAPRASPRMMYLFANTVTMSGGIMMTRAFAAMSQ